MDGLGSERSPLWWGPDWSKAEQDHAGVGTGDQSAPGDRTGEDAAGWRASMWEGTSLQPASSSALGSFKDFRTGTSGLVFFPTCKCEMQ